MAEVIEFVWMISGIWAALILVAMLIWKPRKSSLSRHLQDLRPLDTNLRMDYNLLRRTYENLERRYNKQTDVDIKLATLRQMNTILARMGEMELVYGWPSMKLNQSQN